MSLIDKTHYLFTFPSTEWTPFEIEGIKRNVYVCSNSFPLKKEWYVENDILLNYSGAVRPGTLAKRLIATTDISILLEKEGVHYSYPQFSSAFLQELKEEIESQNIVSRVQVKYSSNENPHSLHTINGNIVVSIMKDIIGVKEGKEKILSLYRELLQKRYLAKPFDIEKWLESNF